MKIRILDSATLGEDIDLSPILAIGETEVYGLTERDRIAERLDGADVCVINKVKLDGEILAKAPSLKLICIAATGYDNIDVEYCRNNGIAVCNVAGYSSESVAQLTVAMTLYAATHLGEYRESVASGRYSAGKVQNILTPIYHEIYGKTWGVIGYGNIGKRVADVARALGCSVKIYKKTPIEGDECVSLEELLCSSDIISLHVPLNGETNCMISEKEIALMKDGVVLINVARGRVTDEKAVASALKSGKIGFLGADVYSTEPMPTDHPYYEIKAMPNVCLTPHMAWGAHESRARCMSEIAKNIISFAEGKKRNRVD